MNIKLAFRGGRFGKEEENLTGKLDGAIVSFVSRLVSSKSEAIKCF